MKYKILIGIVLTMVCVVVAAKWHRKKQMERAENIALSEIKRIHPDWQKIEPIIRVDSITGLQIANCTIKYVISFQTKYSSESWYYIEERDKWMKMTFPEVGFCDPENSANQSPIGPRDGFV